MRYRCWAEVDLTALSENLAWIRHRVNGSGRNAGNKQVITVVKADAYGHGLKQIAGRLMQSGTDVFGVANLAEAQTILKVGKGWPVLMMGYCLPEEIEPVIRDRVTVTISSLEEAQALAKAAVKLKQKARVHIKVDTGMGRLGVPCDGVVGLLDAVRQLPSVEVTGLFTHYASVEDDPIATREQAKRFQSVLQSIGENLPPLIHVNNSGGVLLEDQTSYNAVRPGLLVYGVVPAGKRRVTTQLKKAVRPALTWKCRVGLVKTIGKGTALSYGSTYAAPRRMKVATITAGFGDGYMRSGTGEAKVLIAGKRCRVLGRITMDQMLADVTGVPVQSGDEVVMIGTQAGASITAGDLAKMFGTVSWEVLTGISYRVPRIYRGAEAA